MATWSYTVTYVETSKDITSSVIAIDKMTDVGSGEINSATLILNARHGDFITNANSGDTPILDEFDKIKIEITDKNGDSYRRIFEIDTLVPKKTIQEGIRLEVELLGQERCLQQVHFAKQYYYENAFNVAKDIVDRYSVNKGSAQVTIEKQDDTSYNILPKWTANNYDFGSSEMFCYDGLTELIDKLGTSISGGGANDFFELGFDDPDKVSGVQDATKIYFKGFSSGSFPSSTSNYTTLENATTLPIYNTNGTLEAKSGTVVVGKGSTGFGSFPTNASEFTGVLEAFLLTPYWQSGVTYPIDSRVRVGILRYICNTATTAEPPDSDWTEVDIYDLPEFSSDFRYSHWTKLGLTSALDGYKSWRNCGSASENLATGDYDKHGCWDSNLCIRDEDNYRTWVDCKVANNPSQIPPELLFDDTDLYRGLRVLCTGSLTAFGLSGTGRPLQYNGTDWSIIRASVDGDQTAVIDEGINYVYNGVAWSDDSGFNRGNDCFHIYDDNYSEQGVATLANGGSGSDTNYGFKSAMSNDYRFTPYASQDALVFNVPNYYSIGAWINFRFPFPPNSYNSETIGEIYGGDSDSDYEPVTFDPTNFHMLSDGKTGFNQTNSKEMGTCDALRFFIRMKWFYMYAGDENQFFQFGADYKMRCFCYDTSDNVVVQDFTISHDNNWEEQVLSLSAFKIYRARTSLRITDAVSNAIVPELEIQEIFEWKNLRMIGIQLQEVYDDEGRYSPSTNRFGNPYQSPFPTGIRLSVDNFGFTKQLLAVSGTDSTRNIEPTFLERPFTTNYMQLKNDVDSQLLIEKFRYQAFDIEGEGECDPNLQFGYSFYLKDDKLVNLQDKTDDGGSDGGNTIRLVAKRIEYSINGTDGGTGGFVRKILGVKRISA